MGNHKIKYYVDTLDSSGERWVRICEKYWKERWYYKELPFDSYQDAMKRVYEEEDLCRIVEIHYHYIPCNDQTRENNNG